MQTLFIIATITHLLQDRTFHFLLLVEQADFYALFEHFIISFQVFELEHGLYFYILAKLATKCFWTSIFLSMHFPLFFFNNWSKSKSHHRAAILLGIKYDHRHNPLARSLLPYLNFPLWNPFAHGYAYNDFKKWLAGDRHLLMVL